jgi:glycosyltransferase involved in cell wall biosynthesis
MASPISLAVFVPYFCHPSENFIIDSTRLDPQYFRVSVVTFTLSDFAKKQLPANIAINITEPQNLVKTLQAYEIVHIHHLNNLRAIPLPTLQNQKVYVTCHGEDVFKYGRDPLYRWQLKNKMKWVTQFLCVSQNLKTDLLKYFPATRNKIQVTPLGIDLKKYPFKPKAQTSKVWQLGVAARLVDYKGVDDLIRAGKILKDQDSAFCIHIIGTGPEEFKLTNLANKLGLTKHIQWHGWLANKKLTKALQKLDVYVGPYKVGKGGAQDSMTMILKEVMAMGIPVVATTNSAIPELIQSGKHGLLIEPNNPAALALAIQNILSNNQLRKKLIRTARQHIQKNFNLIDQTQRLLKITKIEV